MDMTKFEKKAVEIINKSCKEAASVAYRDAAYDVFRASLDIIKSHPDIAKKFNEVSEAICQKASNLDK